MKALILAAGFGTRLLPFTEKIPKPLFTILSKPMLEHAILNLVNAGCEQILINTHHLSDQIQAFVLKSKFNLKLIYEPVILDTGGAIANAKLFLKDSPFFVINSDIISNVNLNRVYEFHRHANCLATLVLHDHEKFNKVTIDDQGYIQNFNAKLHGLAFTGIQILSPEIFNYFPDTKTFSSISLYQHLSVKKQIKAFVEKEIFWADIGTKESYSMTSLLELAAFQFGIQEDKIKAIQIDKLAGDGSDRLWYRATFQQQSYVICDHGICLPDSEAFLQINAFVRIGHHLLAKQIPVSSILNHDVLSGMVILDDLGDVHLETLIKQENNDDFTLEAYKTVIDRLIDFSIQGAQGFKTEWTCQTPTYSKELIVEKECRYFMEAFLQGYLKLNLFFSEFSDEFNHIADHALKHGFLGLMHRDLQSRNIMMNKGQPFFIDFQSARLGPLQYDLASLLIDPYVCLGQPIKENLLHYTMKKLKLNPGECHDFLQSYQYCCLTRNLQFLGAFSFLSQKKKKPAFEHYIPDAVSSLKNIITGLDTDSLPKLSRLIQTL